MKCKSCGMLIEKPFLDYGKQPLPNSFLPETGNYQANIYPLKLYYCPNCHLVQLMETVNPQDIFHAEYKYFSSCSDLLLNKCETFTDMIIQRLALTPSSRIIEIASNDGYQLQYFQARGFDQILGIEPTRSTAKQALAKGIPTMTEFFSKQLAEKIYLNGPADLVIANNVIAHVPDLNDFISGIEILLSNNGVAVVEFQYLDDLVSNHLFDLVYHEHYSYFSLHAIDFAFRSNGLKVYKIERIDTQGGSLRIYACRENRPQDIDQTVKNLLLYEKTAGLTQKQTYAQWSQKVQKQRSELYQFLRNLKNAGKSIAAYGAPAKGNIFLNYVGITNQMIDFTVDRNKNKQNLRMSGSNIPVSDPSKLEEEKPDYVVILPWNLKNEIMEQNQHIRDWDGKFIVMMPKIEIH